MNFPQRSPDFRGGGIRRQRKQKTRNFALSMGKERQCWDLETAPELKSMIPGAKNADQTNPDTMEVLGISRPTPKL